MQSVDSYVGEGKNIKACTEVMEEKFRIIIIYQERDIKNLKMYMANLIFVIFQISHG
jgi:hypothetical protein